MYKNLAAALAAACFFAPVFSQTPATTKAAPAPVVKAGFVYVSPITEAGWTRQHDEGRKAVVRDNEGHEVIPAGHTLSDPQILQMNWLAEGVQGKLPR